jgi:hypothetical protein
VVTIFSTEAFSDDSDDKNGHTAWDRTGLDFGFLRAGNDIIKQAFKSRRNASGFVLWRIADMGRLSARYDL